jgi:hypothetical protein
MRARILVVLVVLGLTGVTGCGSDDAAPPTTAAAKAAPATKVVRGFGFEVSLPYRWSDVRDQLGSEGSGEAQLDIAFGNREATGFKPSVSVARHRSAAITAGTLADLEADLRRSAKNPEGATTGRPSAVRLGGDEALRTTTRGTQGGQAVQQRQILAKHDGSLVTVLFTSAVGDADADAAFALLTRSWRWTS